MAGWLAVPSSPQERRWHFCSLFLAPRSDLGVTLSAELFSQNPEPASEGSKYMSATFMGSSCG